MSNSGKITSLHITRGCSQNKNSKDFVMLLERINLQHQLEKVRKKETSEEALLEDVRKILHEEEIIVQEILDRVNHGVPDDGEGNNLKFDDLESDRIFHLSQIKNICISYRLRFLNTRYYKDALPQDAIAAIKKMEDIHETKLKGFKIMAPAQYFKLENADDPMLFVPLGNNYFYLIHKWGRDMHPLRKLIMWPLKDLEHLIIFSFFSSFLLAFGVRELFFHRFQETSEFIVIFMYTFKSLIALIFFYGISMGKNFSSGNWNSKFFN